MKKWYLTIDDGPHKDFEERCIALEKLGIRAIWYCQGDQLEKYGDLVIRAIRNGHVIGNHSYDHPFFSKIDIEEGKAQILRTDILIERLYEQAGVPRKIKTFRFPYLDIGNEGGDRFLDYQNPKVMDLNRYLHQLGYSQPMFEGEVKDGLVEKGLNQCIGVDCTLDTRDWLLDHLDDEGELFHKLRMFDHIKEQIENNRGEKGYELVLAHSFVPLDTFIECVQLFLNASAEFDCPTQQREMHLEPVERKDEHHIQKHQWIMDMPNREGVEVILFGDSLTRRWEDYPDTFNKYFGSYQTWNFGVGGDTLNHMMWRIDNGQLDHLSPKVALVLAGTNSLNEFSDDKVIQGINRVIQSIRDKCPKTKLLIHGLFPRNGDGMTKDYVSRIREINKEIKGLCMDDDIFVDMMPVLLGDGEQVPEAIMPDGLHLNEPGYQLWGDVLEPLLKSL